MDQNIGKKQWIILESLRQSPDGKRLTFLIENILDNFFKYYPTTVWLDGKEYENMCTPFYFSPDGKHVAYMQGEKRQIGIYVDEKNKDFA